VVKQYLNNHHVTYLYYFSIVLSID